MMAQSDLRYNKKRQLPPGAQQDRTSNTQETPLFLLGLFEFAFRYRFLREILLGD